MRCWMINPKSILYGQQDRVFIEKIDWSDMNKFFKNFRNWGKYRYRSIIAYIGFITDLYMGSILAIFNEAGKIPKRKE